MNCIWRNGIGQDSHRFVEPGESDGKELVLGGVTLKGETALAGNSDADVILHALCNAISSVTGVNILGAVADRLAAQGITDSAEYLKEALATLAPNHNPAGRRFELVHVAISIEAKRPHLAKHIPAIKERVAQLCGLDPTDVGMTATTGEGLTSFGRGEGVAGIVQVTVKEIIA